MLLAWAPQQAGAAGVPDPIVVSDFANAVYELNGVPVSYADLWTGAGYWVPDPTAFITPGVGLTCDNTEAIYDYPLNDHPGYVQKYVQAGPTPTNGLRAALGFGSPDVGYTIVIDYEIQTNDYSKITPGCAVDVPNDAFDAGAELFCNTHFFNNAWGLRNITDTNYNAEIPASLGQQRIAILVSQERYAGSLEGGLVAVASGGSGAPEDLTSSWPTPTVYVVGDPTVSARATMSKISFYPRVNDLVLRKMAT